MMVRLLSALLTAIVVSACSSPSPPEGLENLRALAYAGAGRVQRAIERTPSQSCSAIAETVRRATEPLLEELKQLQAKYDRDTRHGILQGTRF
ncbi:DUF922 domain-containing protein [Gemmatimonas sp.]